MNIDFFGEILAAYRGCCLGSLYSERADNEGEVDVSCLAPRCGEMTIGVAKLQRHNKDGESSNRDYEIVVFVGFIIIIIKLLQLFRNLRVRPERVGCGCHCDSDSDKRDNEDGEPCE